MVLYYVYEPSRRGYQSSIYCDHTKMGLIDYFLSLDPNPAAAARAVCPQSGRSRPEKRPFFHIFPHFSKIEQSKRFLPHIGVQYIKLKPMKFQIKCKRNRFVLIRRYALVRIRIWVFALNLGGILREFWEILGKYRILDGRPLGSIGLKIHRHDF